MSHVDTCRLENLSLYMRPHDLQFSLRWLPMQVPMNVALAPSMAPVPFACLWLTMRMAAQIASTWEGIRACEALQKQGVDCNMTLLFSFAQARSCGQNPHDHAHALTGLGQPAWIHPCLLVLAVCRLRAHCDKAWMPRASVTPAEWGVAWDCALQKWKR